MNYLTHLRFTDCRYILKFQKSDKNSALISNDRNIKYQTNSVCNIFTLEILKAIQITQFNDDKKYLIISGSLTTLISIHKYTIKKKTPQPIIVQTINKINDRQYKISFARIPGRVVIKENQDADQISKSYS